MGKGGTVLGLIGIILAAGSIGFTYIVWNGQNTSNNLTGTIVVGIWDEIDDNEDYAPYNLNDNWLFEFGAHNLSNTDYISVSNTNTRITLLKAGWYRIHLSVLLGDMDLSADYYITMLKDGDIEFYLEFYDTVSASVGWYYTIDSSAFVYSNGTNYIEINGYASGDPDGFGIVSVNTNNQLTIEYVIL